jgi:hypothetical protein
MKSWLALVDIFQTQHYAETSDLTTCFPGFKNAA